MSTVVERAKSEPPWESDPWRYGWRYVQVPTPDGGYQTKQVPLNQQDVLHPQEGDFIMETPAHDRDCEVIKHAIETRLQGRPGVVVLRNCRIDWGVPGVEPHGPDVAVLQGVGEWEPSRGTFHVAEHHAQPLLVIEVTSPSTREVDLDEKVVEYHQAGIPFYAIVDGRVVRDRREVRLLGYRWTPDGYLRVPLDAQGRLWLEPVDFWLRVDGTQVTCIDRQGNLIGVHLDTVREKEEAKQQLANEKARADALEQRLLQLEAELQKRDNPPS